MRSVALKSMKGIKVNLAEHLEMPDEQIDISNLDSRLTLGEIFAEYNATNPCVILNCLFERYLRDHRESALKTVDESSRTPVKQSIEVVTPQTLKSEEPPPELDLPLPKECDSIDDAFKPSTSADSVSIEPSEKAAAKALSNLGMTAETCSIPNSSSESQPSITVPSPREPQVEQYSLVQTEPSRHKAIQRYDLDDDHYSYNMRMFGDVPVLKEGPISHEQALKAREICSYLKGYNNMCLPTEPQCLKILDSLRILSDHIGVQGESVHDLVETIEAYFEATFGYDIMPCASFESAQLHEACLDYVRLGYIALHYRCVAVVRQPACGM